MNSSKRVDGAQARTNWTGIIALFIAGVAIAGQVGKAPVAIPALRDGLGLSLTFGAWIVSIYAVFGATAGLPFGLTIGRIGMRRATIAGLGLVALGSAIGAIAPNGAVLIASRMIESCGYLTVSVAAPSLIRNFANDRDRDSAMVLWSLFMPVGSSIVMFGGPFLLQFGWRVFWAANAIFVLIALIGVWALVPARPTQAPQIKASLKNVRDAVATPGITLVCLIALAYAFQYFALVGLMPTYLIEYKGLSVAAAGTIVASMVAFNGCGNIIAGFLMRAKIPVWILILASFGVGLLSAPFIYSDFAPIWLIVALSFLVLVISAMTPGVMWSAIPRFATTAPILGIAFGMLIQANNIGQLAGASAMGAFAEHLGWTSGAMLLIAVGAVGVGLALWMRKLERRARASL